VAVVEQRLIGASLNVHRRSTGEAGIANILVWYISLFYSATILAQQVIALQTELQRPKPL
jgi:hypothetical protein